MSSFENKFFSSSQDSVNQPSSSFSSRPSNTLARLAFNIYGSSNNNNSNNNNNTASGSPNASNISGRGTPPSFSRQHSMTPPSPSPTHSLHPPHTINQKRYKASFELTSFSLLHNDTQELAAIAGKNSLQVLDISRGKVMNDLLPHQYAVKNKKMIGSILDVSTGYGSNNRYVATSTTTGSILIFNTQTGNNRGNKLAYKLSDHSRAVNSVHFSPLDHNLLLSGSQDGQMKIWDLRSNLMKPTITMHGNADAVRCLKFSPFNNKKFVSIFDSGVIQKWDIRQFAQFEKKFNAHTGPGLTLDWNSELDYIVSGGRDKQLQIWNMGSSDTRQIPDHVIYTASPISKVSFRPNSNLTSIGNAEIATSFLNNDIGQVQVYSLRRKYIPLFTIENHTSQITGLNFQSESTLLTCSKDKFFVMDDVSNYRATVENLSVASTTWSPENSLLYVNQAQQNHTLIEEFEQVSYPSQHPAHPQHNSLTSNASTSPNNVSFMSNPVSSASLNFPASALMTPSLSMSSVHDQMTPVPLASPRPGLSRSATNFPRPSLNRNLSHGSGPSNSSRHQSQHYFSSVHQVYQKVPDSNSVINPLAIPVDLPINKSNDILDYLTTNYVFDPTEKPILEICDYNSAVAHSVGNFRDSQTWNVIKESLKWEASLDEALNYTNTQEEVYMASIHGESESFRSGDTQAQGPYSTSNSTNYGKSPSLSDLSEFNNSSVNSIDRLQPLSSSFKISSLKQSILKNSVTDSNADDIIEEEEDTVQAINSTITKDEVLKWDIEPTKESTPQLPADEKMSDNALERSSTLEFSDSKSIPIINSKKIRRASSIGARSISPSFSLDSGNFSPNSQSLFRPIIHRNLQLSPMASVSSTPSVNASHLSRKLVNESLNDDHDQRPLPPQEHTVRPQKSAISELTRQLTNTLGLDDDARVSSALSGKVPPYAPNKMIMKAIEFSLNQGDLIMCCTLLLLFNGKYKIYSNDRFKEVIFGYLTHLQRLRFFIQFTKICIFLNENEDYKNLDIDLTTVSKTSSSIRHFCSNCGKLIMNEDAKAKALSEKSPHLSTQVVGTWFCESCSARNKCIYCNEILKKLSLIKLKCGHNGHFGCLKHWFVDLEMEECPGGCI